MNYKSGHVVGVNGNLVKVAFDDTVIKNEVGFILVGDESLKGEVIRIVDGVADLQEILQVSLVEIRLNLQANFSLLN